MQKFCFLLPLLILTLTVVAVSYSIQSFQTKNNADVSSGESTQGAEDIVYESESENSENSGGLLARIFGTRKSSNATSSQGNTTSNNTTTITATPALSPIVANFTESEVNVPINQERTVFISLESGTNTPTAYTFNMKFDPASISVTKVEPGDIWQQTSIFTNGNTINNVNGTLSFSAGQSLGTQKASGTTLIKVTLKAKANAATGSELTILDSSKFAYVGLDSSVPVRSQSIKVQVTK